jgi:RimJ/RimL family protein N-acetyltransferase
LNARVVLPVRAAYGAVVLRHFGIGDAARVAELCGDPLVATMTAAIPHPYTAAMAEEWIGGKDDEAGLHYTYAVLRRADEALVGAVGLRPNPAAEDMLGYWIGRPYWGRGYATDAATATLAFAFTLLNVESVHARHLERNPASGRVLAKCGMRELRRESSPHRGGPPEPFRIWSVERAAWLAWMDR